MINKCKERIFAIASDLAYPAVEIETALKFFDLQNRITHPPRNLGQRRSLLCRRVKQCGAQLPCPKQTVSVSGDACRANRSPLRRDGWGRLRDARTADQVSA